MALLFQIVSLTKDLLWGYILSFFIFAAGIYFTLLLKGIQFRYLKAGLKEAFFGPKRSNKGDIPHFQTLMTSLAAAIGTGNIAGVATAITVGGFGSLFWIWITAFLVMATKFAEAFLSVKYRKLDENGNMVGGPMVYIERGLGYKRLAVAFAVIGVIASTGTGNLIQANSLADAFTTVFDVNPLYIGCFLSLTTAIVLVGGIQSIGRVTSFLVPIMALTYILAGVGVLIYFYQEIPSALNLILKGAFSGQAAAGGFLGSTVMLSLQLGVSRAILTSEVGVGTTAITDATAMTDHPARQGLVSMTGVFLSTILVCSVTGLVLAVSGVVGTLGPDGNLLTGSSLAIKAFTQVYSWGGYLVIFGLVLFAYSTIIAWAYAGEKCWEYLFGVRAIFVYRIFFVLLLIPASVLDLEFVWAFADVMNGLMSVPNLIGILLLSPIVKREAQIFLSKEIR